MDASGPEDFALKEITKDGIPAAVKRAEHYRLLNQPALAKSICLDVLEIEPNNQASIVTLILAITDQFGGGGSANSPRAASEYVDKLDDGYKQAYYAGIIHEREARSLLGKAQTEGFAYDGFRQAMDLYEEAAAIRPEGNDDAILRWNACVRTIQDRRLTPRQDERELGLE